MNKKCFNGFPKVAHFDDTNDSIENWVQSIHHIMDNFDDLVAMYERRVMNIDLIIDLR